MSRLLIAEDSPAIRLLLIRRLEMAGHEVVAATDGSEALEILGDTAPEDLPEVVLLDAMMPTTGGAEALREIKAAQPGIPVLVVSAVSGIEGSGDWSSADGHIRKPIDFDDLLGQIENLTSGPRRS